MKKWRLYCETDDRAEFVWRADAPTMCPTNGEHIVRENSVDVAATVTQFKRLDAHNSPYRVTTDNFFVVDTAEGDVSILLPTAGGKNDGKVIYFVKESSSDENTNSIIVSPVGGELIDGSPDAETVIANHDSLKLVSNGTNNWISVSVRDTDGATQDEQIDLKKEKQTDIWIFHSTLDNSLNGGTNIANSWSTRSFNQTKRDSGSDVQFFSQDNTFVLSQGCYQFHAECVFFKTDFTRMRLRNITDSSNEAVSLNAYAGLGVEASCTVLLDHVIVVDSAEPKTFRLEYFCTRQQTGNGLGRANGTGDAELYASVRFIKV